MNRIVLASMENIFKTYLTVGLKYQLCFSFVVDNFSLDFMLFFIFGTHFISLPSSLALYIFVHS